MPRNLIGNIIKCFRALISTLSNHDQNVIFVIWTIQYCIIINFKFIPFCHDSSIIKPPKNIMMHNAVITCSIPIKSCTIFNRTVKPIITDLSAWRLASHYLHHCPIALHMPSIRYVIKRDKSSIAWV